MGDKSWKAEARRIFAGRPADLAKVEAEAKGASAAPVPAGAQ